MPTKTKAATKAVKSPIKQGAKKVTPTSQKAVPKATASVKPPANKPTARAKAGKKKDAGLIQTMKHGVKAGIESVGDLVKKVTPDVLRRKPAKSKRK